MPLSRSWARRLDTIAARFYETMFSDRPELLDGLFNRGNQRSGEQRRALAGSIASFAGALLDNPDERPDALLTRIAHKHAAAGPHRRPVRDRAQVPLRRDRRGARRCRHAGGRRGLGRGLLADGRRADRHGGAHLRPARASPAGDTWRSWRSPSAARRPPTSCRFVLAPIGDEPAARARPASTSASGCACPTEYASCGSTPCPGTARTGCGGSPSSGCAARARTRGRGVQPAARHRQGGRRADPVGARSGT